MIEPSYSKLSSPIVLVPKPNGKWRLCIDYRKVNDATIKDSYSLPNIDEIFDSLDGVKFFTPQPILQKISILLIINNNFFIILSV